MYQIKIITEYVAWYPKLLVSYFGHSVFGHMPTKEKNEFPTISRIFSVASASL